MTQLMARILTATALLVAALAGPARAEDILLWTAQEDGGLVSLSYGSFDQGKIPIFMLSCFNGMNIAVLNLHEELSGTEPGQKITIEIAAETAKTPVQGEAARNERDGPLFAEASGIAIAPVLKVLKEPGPLTVSVGDTRVTLSDTGRPEAVAVFSKDCQVE
jgi:hypothetical protein